MSRNLCVIREIYINHNNAFYESVKLSVLGFSTFWTLIQ